MRSDQQGQFVQREVAFLFDRYLLPYLQDQRTLDAGCSSGHYLSRLGPGSVGLDYYDPDLAECQRQNLRVARADLNQPLCFQDGQFERVFCGHVLEHVEAPVRLLREFHRILQPRGMLVLGLPVERTVQQWLGENHYFRAHEGHLYAFSVDNVRVLLQKTGFGCQRFLVEPWPGRKLQRVGLLRAALWLAQVLPLPWSLGWSNGLWVVAIKEQE